MRGLRVWEVFALLAVGFVLSFFLPDEVTFGFIAVVLLVAMVLARRNELRHVHQRVDFHSFRRFINSLEIVGTCLDCGKSTKVNLGHVAETESAEHRAADTTLAGQGWTFSPNEGDKGIWIREAA